MVEMTPEESLERGQRKARKGWQEGERERKGKWLWVEHGGLYIGWEYLFILSSLFDHSEPRNNYLSRWAKLINWSGWL